MKYFYTTSPSKCPLIPCPILIDQDPHWRGYSQQCAPCLANFTYIIHLEQPGEEGWVLGRTGLKSLVGNVSRVMNPTTGGSSQSESTVEAFAKQLSCATIQRLYHRSFLTLSKTLAHILSDGDGAPIYFHIYLLQKSALLNVQRADLL